MKKEDLFNIKLTDPDIEVYRETIRKWDSLSKPIDGFGDFEKAIARIAAIQKTPFPKINDRCAVIMCADNGIVEEGISQSSREITKSVAINLGNGTSSACTLAKASNTTIIPIDIGIDTEEKIPGIIDRKIRRGSGNFLKEEALSEDQVLKAIETGISTVEQLKNDGFSIIATGEMGIGNTTTSAVILCFLLGLDPMTFTGRGAGLDDIGLERKKEVVRSGTQILEGLHLSDGREKAFACLNRIGGLDIAGLAGIYIGAALFHIPVVIDGMISAAAAVTAQMLVPGTKEFMIASHEGRECSIIKALEYLDCRPFIRGNMALGEGTGAIMLFPLLDQILFFFKNAKSFDEVNIEAYSRYEGNE